MCSLILMCSSFHCGIIQILSNFTLAFLTGLKLVFHFCLAITLALLKFSSYYVSSQIWNSQFNNFISSGKFTGFIVHKICRLLDLNILPCYLRGHCCFFSQNLADFLAIFRPYVQGSTWTCSLIKSSWISSLYLAQRLLGATTD